MPDEAPDQRFPPRLRIRRSADFRRVMSDGRHGVSHHVVAFLFPGGRPRLGIVASRKVGGAVQRNRVRRRLREIWRRAATRPAGELVLLARVGIADASPAGLERSFRDAVRRAGRRRAR